VLVYIVFAIWCIAICVHGPEVRIFPAISAVGFCPISVVLFFLLFSKWRFTQGGPSRFKNWNTIWLILGLGSAIVLFLLDRAVFVPNEGLLFTIWPSYLILMVPGGWDVRGVVLAFLINAALYTAWSSMVGWVLRRFPQLMKAAVRKPQAPDYPTSDY
jgi:hypothetical protein